LGCSTTQIAAFDLVLNVFYRVGEVHRLDGFGLEYMEGEPFGGLRPDARQPAELLNQPVQSFGVNITHRFINMVLPSFASTAKIL
jgi:hypothetical protein